MKFIPSSPEQDPILRWLIEWEVGKDDMRAMILTSSRAKPGAPLDALSDYDVILVERRIVLQAVESWLRTWLGSLIAVILAICVAAVGAGLMHSYQGPRAMVIITQLSVLFGILFVVKGHNLWAVIICHGLCDTIAFVRFARKES